MSPPHSEVPLARRIDMAGLARASQAGCFVEVGVYQGGTAWHLYKIAQEQGRALHLFDTFTGMPFREAGDIYKVGAFGATTAESVQRQLPEAHIYPGIFPSTLPSTLRDIAFAHLDVDQYRSTREAIAALIHLMVPGGIMAFDDYPGIMAVVRAVDEVFPGKVQFTTNRYAYVCCHDRLD